MGMGQYTGELIHYLIRDIADVGKYFFAGLAAFFAAGDDFSADKSPGTE